MTNREKFEAEIRAMNDADFLNLITGNAGKIKYGDRICRWCKMHRLRGRECRDEDECDDYAFLNAEAELLQGVDE